MTPRPKKPRTCSCATHQSDTMLFKPVGIPLTELEQIIMAHDEFDALNLCDGQGMTQEQAGKQMGVSRGTIQRLVTSGRKKMVAVLNGKQALVIDSENGCSDSERHQTIPDQMVDF